MKKKLILPVFLITLAIAGCSAQNQSTTVSSKTETTSNSNDLIDVYMDVNPYFKDGQLGFYLETNLPDTTKLSANLHSIDGDYKSSSDDIEVLNSKSSFRFFNDKGKSLPAGDYELTVYALASTKQSKEVLSVVGDDFKNLTGDLINNKNGISVEKIIPITVEEQKEISSIDTTNLIDVYMNINPIVKDGKLECSIETNLPDTTKLSANLHSIDKTYNATDGKIEVTNGKCSFGPFSNKGENLSDGNYELTIYVLATSQQNENIKSILGDAFKNLTGDLVHNENGISIEKTIPIAIGSKSSIKEQEEQNETLAENHKKILKDLYDELISECDSQSQNYNEVEFAQFLSDWNSRRTTAQQTFDDENANPEYGIAIRDLIYLSSELQNKIKGEKYDNGYVNSITYSIETTLQ